MKDRVTITLPLWVAIIAHEVLLEEYERTQDRDAELMEPRHEAVDIATDILYPVIPEDHSERERAVDQRIGGDPFHITLETGR